MARWIAVGFLAFTLPGFATGERTKDNATRLATALGVLGPEAGADFMRRHHPEVTFYIRRVEPEGLGVGKEGADLFLGLIVGERNLGELVVDFFDLRRRQHGYVTP